MNSEPFFDRGPVNRSDANQNGSPAWSSSEPASTLSPACAGLHHKAAGPAL